MSKINIALLTQKKAVNHGMSLKNYYRSAENLLRQASIYRGEDNIIDQYVMLMRFSSLVTETIASHRDYNSLCQREKDEYRKKLVGVIVELEKLYPDVQKAVKLHNERPVPSAPPLPAPGSEGGSSWVPYQPDSQLATAPGGYGQSLLTQQPDSQLAAARGGYGQATLTQQPAAAVGGDPWDMAAAQPAVNGMVSSFQGLDLLTGPTLPPPTRPAVAHPVPSMSIVLPRASAETLARHSFLGTQNASSWGEPRVYPSTVAYPQHVDASPIPLPTLGADGWSIPGATQASQPAAPPPFDPIAALQELEVPTPPMAPLPPLPPQAELVRQPLPPPLAVPVTDVVLPARTSPPYQPSPDSVADPRPGPGDINDTSKGPKPLHISVKLMDEFLKMAKANTGRNLETCGVLAGVLKKSIFYVSTLIIPKQESTSDSCNATNEEEIFEAQDSRGLFQLGWIHTHPTQTCFMSSIDLHTHYSYQVMLQEAIAVVMAPKDPSRSWGIFRLSDPEGVQIIQRCDRRGFHAHDAPPSGGPIYEHSRHVMMNAGLPYEVIDLRRK